MTLWMRLIWRNKVCRSVLGPALILVDWNFERNEVNPFFGSPFFFIRITNDCIGRAMIPVMTSCLLFETDDCECVWCSVSLWIVPLLLSEIQILSRCYQQHLGVIIPQLLQNVISHEAAPALFLGWNRTLAFYLALTRFSIYFPENGSKV